ncbi:MAG TPA: hypothetical protein VKB18_06735 [Gemmatimonadota bacterium]|nr:hypothetical protein [Gemmatimonadota bacterium]
MAPSSSRSEPQLSDVRASPVVALALLEAMRSADTPLETLEDEVLRHSLPRRLGLSDVVEGQIRRFRQLVDKKQPATARQLADLFALVDRRDDAPVVFSRAGRWLVHHEVTGGKERAGAVKMVMPAPIRRRMALRAAASLAGMVSPSGRTRTERGPLALVVEGSLPAYACGSSTGCHIVTAAFAETLQAYRMVDEDDTRSPAAHPMCESRGDACCIWRTVG